MINFISLTQPDGHPVMIRLDMISMVRPVESVPDQIQLGRTLVDLDTTPATSIQVLQTVEEISRSILGY